MKVYEKELWQDNEAKKLYDAGDDFLTHAFKTLDDSKRENIVYKLSLLITFYSALQGNHKFRILRIADKFIEHLNKSHTKDLKNCANEIHNFIGKVGGYNSFSIVTKYLFWSKYANAEKPEDYSNFFIYDGLVMNYIKYNKGYFQYIHEVESNYTKFHAIMKEVSSVYGLNDNRLLDKIIWSNEKINAKRKREEAKKAKKSKQNVPNK